MTIAPHMAENIELFPAAKYFQNRAKQLQILAPHPEISLVKSVLEQHLPLRVKRLVPHLANPENSESWLSLILKINFLILLWDAGEQPILVGLNVSGSQIAAIEQLNIIESKEFSTARQKLGISKHWFVIIPGCPPVGPSKDELFDALYEQLEREEECGIINFSAKMQECI